MRFFILLLGVVLPLGGWADVACDFYRYSCMPELDMVEVSVERIDNVEVCQRAHVDKPFRELLAQKGYVTMQGEVYQSSDGQPWHGTPFMSSPNEICPLKGGDVKIDSYIRPLNSKLNGFCGAAPNALHLSILDDDKLIFEGLLGDDCLNPPRIAKVRYSTQKRSSPDSNMFLRQLEVWGDKSYEKKLIRLDNN